MHNITRILTAAVLFTALPACEPGTANKIDTKKTVAKADAKADAKAPDSKTVTTPEPKPADTTPPAADPADEKIQLAATLAKEISGAPDKADEILGKHGLDRDKLDALMFEIAGDPALTKRYMDARSQG